MPDSSISGPPLQLVARRGSASRPQQNARRVPAVTPQDEGARANIRRISLDVPTRRATGPQLTRRARASHNAIVARLSFVADGSPTPREQRRALRSILADAHGLAAVLDALCAMIETPDAPERGPRCS